MTDALEGGWCVDWTIGKGCWGYQEGITTYLICDEEGAKSVDLGLIERDECFEELEAQVDSKPRLRLFWFGLGILVGGGAVAAITN